MCSDTYELPEELKISIQVPGTSDQIVRLVDEAAVTERKQQLYQQLRWELFFHDSSGGRRISISRDDHVLWTILVMLEGDLFFFTMPFQSAGWPDDEHKFDKETCFVLTRGGQILIQPEHIDQLITMVNQQDPLPERMPPHQQAIKNLLAVFERYFGLATVLPVGEEWHWQTFMQQCGQVEVERS